MADDLGSRRDSSKSQVEEFLDKLGDGNPTVDGDEDDQTSEAKDADEQGPPTEETHEEPEKTGNDEAPARPEDPLGMNVLPPTSNLGSNDSDSYKELTLELLARRVHALAGEVEALKAAGARRDSQASQARLREALQGGAGGSRPASAAAAAARQQQPPGAGGGGSLVAGGGGGAAAAAAAQQAGGARASDGDALARAAAAARAAALEAAAAAQEEQEAALEALRADLLREFAGFRADVGARFSAAALAQEQTAARLGAAAGMKDLQVLEAVLADRASAAEHQALKQRLEAAHELDAKLLADLEKIADWKQKLEENVMERVKNLERHAADVAASLTGIKGSQEARLGAAAADAAQMRDWVGAQMGEAAAARERDEQRAAGLAGTVARCEGALREFGGQVRDCFREAAAVEERAVERELKLEQAGDVARELIQENRAGLVGLRGDLSVLEPRADELEAAAEKQEEELHKLRMRTNELETKAKVLEGEIERVVEVEVGYCREKLREAAEERLAEKVAVAARFDLAEKATRELREEFEGFRAAYTARNEEVQQRLNDDKEQLKLQRAMLSTWDFLKPKVEQALANLDQTMRRTHKLEDQRRDYANLFSEIREHVDEFHAQLPALQKENKVLMERMLKLQQALLNVDKKATRGGGNSSFLSQEDASQIAELRQAAADVDAALQRLEEEVQELRDRPVPAPAGDLAPMTIKVPDSGEEGPSPSAPHRGRLASRERLGSGDLLAKMAADMAEFGTKAHSAPYLVDRAAMLGHMCVQYEAAARAKSFCPALTDEWRAVMGRACHDVAAFVATAVDIRAIAQRMQQSADNLKYAEDEIGALRTEAVAGFLELVRARVARDHPDAGILKLEARGAFFKRITEGLEMALSKFEKILVIGQSRVSATVPKCIACDRHLLNAQHRDKRREGDFASPAEAPSLAADPSLAQLNQRATWGARPHTSHGLLGQVRPPSSRRKKGLRRFPSAGATAAAGRPGSPPGGLLASRSEATISSRDWISPRPTTSGGPGGGAYVMRGGFRMPKNQMQLTSPELVAELVQEQASAAAGLSPPPLPMDGSVRDRNAILSAPSLGPPPQQGGGSGVRVSADSYDTWENSGPNQIINDSFSRKL